MQKIDKILFLLDLTTYSLPSLDYALTISKLYNAKLYILHVIDNSPFEIIPRESREMNELFLIEEENARVEMNRYIREKLNYYQNIIQVIKCGNVKEEVKKFAEKENINFIISEQYDEIGIFEIEKVNEKTSLKQNIPMMNNYRSNQKADNHSVLDVDNTYYNFDRVFLN